MTESPTCASCRYHGPGRTDATVNGVVRSVAPCRASVPAHLLMCGLVVVAVPVNTAADEPACGRYEPSRPEPAPLETKAGGPGLMAAAGASPAGSERKSFDDVRRRKAR